MSRAMKKLEVGSKKLLQMKTYFLEVSKNGFLPKASGLVMSKGS